MFFKKSYHSPDASSVFSPTKQNNNSQREQKLKHRFNIKPQQINLPGKIFWSRSLEKDLLEIGKARQVAWAQVGVLSNEVRIISFKYTQKKKKNSFLS